MHNIPVFVLTAVLVISWKHELVGGIVFSLVGLLFAARMVITMLTNRFEWGGLFGALPLAVPALLIGILFITGWLKKRTGRSDVSVK